METIDLKALTKRPSLRNAVQNRLEEAIVRGGLKYGQQLVENEMAHWLGVSRALVREAFREFEKTGMITCSPYKGTFVRSLTALRVQELYTLRKKLEEFAIELTIPKVTDADIHDLETLIDLMRKNAADNNTSAVIDLDLQFHQRLYSISHHDMLIDLLNGLGRQTHIFNVLTKVVYSIFPTLQDVAESHAPLLEAVRQRDAQTAGPFSMLKWDRFQY